MKRISSSTVLALALLMAGDSLLRGQGSLADKEPVVIVLQPEAVVDDTVVTLEQIAKIHGGGAYLRQRIAKLDVADMKLGVDRVTISSEQVRFRLLLADIDASRFRLSGAKRTVVSESDAPASLRRLTATAEKALRQKYPGDLGKLLIVPVPGPLTPTLPIRPDDRVQLDATPRGPVPRSGTARVDVAVVVNGSARGTVPLTFELIPDEPRAALTPVSNPAPEKAEILVKARDNVKIVANLGAAQIVCVGEAQQDGRRGDLIRVRNIESNRIIHARVESRGIVFVEY